MQTDQENCVVENFVVPEDDKVVEEVSEYKYTTIDCLDEDKPISGQKYVLMSFISPEGIMNCKIRGLKIRGVFDDYAKAQKMAEKLNSVDKYHHIFIGEVGKWMPWDPSAKQVEEEKYPDEELNKIMKKTHESQNRDLNELVGRHKETMELKGVQHEERVKDSVKKAADEYGKTKQAPAAQTVAVEAGGESKREKGVSKLNRNDKETIKERLRKTVDEGRQRQAQVDQQKMEEKQKRLKDESAKIAGKEQNVESLREEKEKIEEVLRKRKAE